jgi:Ca2+-binding EF-hand superfamily protein
MEASMTHLRDDISELCVRRDHTHTQVGMDDVEQVFKAADGDNSGTIDIMEFKVALSSWKAEMSSVNWKKLAEDLEAEKERALARNKSSSCALL